MHDQRIVARSTLRRVYFSRRIRIQSVSAESVDRFRRKCDETAPCKDLCGKRELSGKRLRKIYRYQFCFHRNFCFIHSQAVSPPLPRRSAVSAEIRALTTASIFPFIKVSSV